MAYYAEYNNTVPSPSPVIGWYPVLDAETPDGFDYPNLPAGDSLLEIDLAQWQGHFADPSAWAVENGTALVPYTAPPPVLTIAQQAAVAVYRGLTIVSAKSPQINAVYACDPAAQQKLNSLFNLIQRNGGNTFPGGLSSLPYPDINGTPRVFTQVEDFLNVETQIGNYVLALYLIETANPETGELPSNVADIP